MDGRVNNQEPSPGVLMAKASIAPVNPQNGLRAFQLEGAAGLFCGPVRLHDMG